MALLKRANPFSKVNNDTGFGNNANDYGGRFVNRDGSFNLRREGMPYWQRFSIYHSMLNLPIGTHEFTGLLASTDWQKVKEIYFFSTETFTTVGYGRVNPVGDMANFVASLEAMSGFLSFAVATGLIYGRFSKPKSFLAFSDFAVVAPYQDKTALMFRFVSYKDNHILTNVEIKVNIGLQVEENGKPVYKFFDLLLERSRVDSLPMNWTVVHPIDEQSPLWSLTAEDMKVADVEVYVLVRSFDDVYSNVVLQRTSYTYDEILFNRKYKPMYRESSDGKTTIVELHKLNESVEVARVLSNQ